MTRIPVMVRREMDVEKASRVFLVGSPEHLRKKDELFLFFHQAKTPEKILHAKGLSGKGPISASPGKTGPIATQTKAGRPEKAIESSSEDDSDSEDDVPVAVTTPQVKPGEGASQPRPGRPLAPSPQLVPAPVLTDNAVRSLRTSAF